MVDPIVRQTLHHFVVALAWFLGSALGARSAAADSAKDSSALATTDDAPPLAPSSTAAAQSTPTGPSPDGSVASKDLALGTPLPPQQSSTAAAGGDDSANAGGARGDLAAEDSSVNAGVRIAAYLQVLGSAPFVGGALSIRPIDNLAVDIGVGVVHFCFDNCIDGYTPSLAAMWLSGGNHNLEVGGSATVLIATVGSTGVFGGPQLGYRYQPLDGGFFFRATLMGVITMDRDLPVVPWPGFSFGGTWGP